MFRLIASFFAFCLLILGVVALISPIPIGVLLIAIAVSILVCVSDTAKTALKRLRTRSHRINHRMHLLEARLEHRFTYLVNAFVLTRPDEKLKDEE